MVRPQQFIAECPPLSGGRKGHWQHGDEECRVTLNTGKRRMLSGQQRFRGIVAKLAEIQRLIRLGGPIRVLRQNHEQPRVLGGIPVRQTSRLSKETIVKADTRRNHSCAVCNLLHIYPYRNQFETIVGPTA